MRLLIFLLVLPLLPGCTLTFGIAGAAFQSVGERQSRRPIALDLSVIDGTPLAVDTRYGTTVTGRWRGYWTPPDDTTRFLLLDRRPRADARVPLGHVVAVRRAPPRHTVLNLMGVGFVLDIAFVALVIHELHEICVYQSCSGPD